MVPDVSPDGLRVLLHLVALLLGVTKEGPKRTGIRVLSKEHEQPIAKLKGRWGLSQQDTHNFQPLYEYRCIFHAVHHIIMATAVVELMPKRQPILLDQHSETLQSSVEGVQHQLCRCAELCRSVPAIAAVHQHRAVVQVKLLGNGETALQDRLDVPQPRPGSAGLQLVGVLGREI